MADKGKFTVIQQHTLGSLPVAKRPVYYIDSAACYCELKYSVALYAVVWLQGYRCAPAVAHNGLASVVNMQSAAGSHY